MPLLYFYFLIVSVFSFIVVGYDKYLARNKKRRISENTLLFWAFLGGSLGARIGMWVFKHKTSKRSFLWKFYGVHIIQLLIGLALYYQNEISPY
jgi:uncharacterized membrane protein YsdA (DUF1294 family)|nr:DUF1294 domain-containing protein [uncultured Flavobacterium sp.]